MNISKDLDQTIQTQYETDKKNVDDFFEHKTSTFNFSSFKRLVLSQLTYNGSFKYKQVCGFTRRQIENICQYPERYGKQIIRLSKFMMRKSGYYKRLIDYFVNMAVINWTVDIIPKSIKFYEVDSKKIKANYIKFSDQVNKFKLDNRVSDIFRRLFVEDICYGFVTDNGIETSIFFIDSDYCEIKELVNGSVFQYAINRSLVDNDYLATIPDELHRLIETSKETSLNNMVPIPYQNSFCIKYNNDFIYPYCPFFPLIEAILEIEDVKELAKAKSEADAYKLIYFKIPLNENDQISMDDKVIGNFVEMAREILPDRFGVIPSPMDLQLVESKSTVSDDTNKVEQSVENYYTEAGISKALISSASSGSELKYSVKVDSSDILRIYRMIEAWVDLQMKIRGYIYKDYQFQYNILPTTIFDIDDYLDRQLKLAQISIPNKGMLLAANGINTAKMLGNTYLENVILKDVFKSWIPLQTSYTQSSVNSDDTGRPKVADEDLTDSGIQTREDDEDNKANRDV